jgi:hypothetical protein
MCVLIEQLEVNFLKVSVIAPTLISATLHFRYPTIVTQRNSLNFNHAV